uniref:Uncharacterized protein n=1 Tax=Oryza meridionalis TaxID=40149 RepID=A0A0E0EFE0_9ORYZ
MADTAYQLDPVTVAGANSAFTDDALKLGAVAGVVINNPRSSSRLLPMANLILAIVAGTNRFSADDTLKVGATADDKLGPVVVTDAELASATDVAFMRLPPKTLICAPANSIMAIATDVLMFGARHHWHHPCTCWCPHGCNRRHGTVTNIIYTHPDIILPDTSSSWLSPMPCLSSTATGTIHSLRDSIFGVVAEDTLELGAAWSYPNIPDIIFVSATEDVVKLGTTAGLIHTPYAAQPSPSTGCRW